MNDPHVSVLIYRVRHDETVDYDKASPLEYETASFKVFVKSRRRLLARSIQRKAYGSSRTTSWPAR